MPRPRFFETVINTLRPDAERSLQKAARESAELALYEFVAAGEQHIFKSLSPNKHYPDFTLNDLVSSAGNGQVVRLDGTFLDTDNVAREGYRWFVLVGSNANASKKPLTAVYSFSVAAAPTSSRLELYLNQIPHLHEFSPARLSPNVAYPIRYADQVFRSTPTTETVGETEAIRVMKGGKSQPQFVHELQQEQPVFTPGLVPQR